MPSTMSGVLSFKLFSGATLCYFLAMMSYFVFVFSKKRPVGIVASSFVYLGFLVHTAAIGLRWKASYDLGYGHAPLSNMYESIVFFAWTIVLIYGLFEIRYKYRSVGVFVLPFAFLTMAFAQYGSFLARYAGTIVGSKKLGNFTISTDVQALLPALQSDWLLYHVLACFLGYAGFAVGCGASIMYLIKARKERGNGDAKAGGILSIFPPTRTLDEINYQAIMIGFPLLTIGIITGSIWGIKAWGTYWSWDNKETWSLIVWLFYAAFLHARITHGWVGRRAAILSIIGFAATIFCYFGVNFLLSGLHSYGSK